jgi:hypothetical protein
VDGRLQLLNFRYQKFNNSKMCYSIAVPFSNAPSHNYYCHSFHSGVSLAFTQESYSVTAGESLLDTACLELGGAVEPTESVIWVNVTSVDGTAIGKQHAKVWR